MDYPLQPPEAAMPPEGEVGSIDAASSMRATFAQDNRPEAHAVLTLLDAVQGLLTGGGARLS